jgi:hypothetical protein
VLRTAYYPFASPVMTDQAIKKAGIARPFGFGYSGDAWVNQ